MKFEKISKDVVRGAIGEEDENDLNKTRPVEKQQMNISDFFFVSRTNTSQKKNKKEEELDFSDSEMLDDRDDVETT